MKTYLGYAAIFAISLGLSIFLHKFTAEASDPQELDAGLSVAKEDIQRLVAEEFRQQEADYAVDSGGDQLLMLRPLENDLRDLQQRQAELLERMDAMMKGDALAGIDFSKLEMPDQPRLEEIVAATIQRHEEQQEREREDRARARREARDAARRERMEKTLTDRLKLVGDQPAQVMAVIDNLNEQRRATWERMREARRNGNTNFDFGAIRTEMSAMQEGVDKQIRGVLNPDQVELYENYKKESPWTFGGGMGMRRGGGRRGGGGN